ncbi:MAG TPA: hypothetical protein VIX19_07140 [Terriglobales bacterium]
MKWGGVLFVLISTYVCWAETGNDSRQEAEYYVAVYARHYNVPVEFVRAVVEQESGWQRCAISPKSFGLTSTGQSSEAATKSSRRAASTHYQ